MGLIYEYMANGNLQKRLAGMALDHKLSLTLHFCLYFLIPFLNFSQIQSIELQFL